MNVPDLDRPPGSSAVPQPIGDLDVGRVLGLTILAFVLVQATEVIE